MAPSGSLIFRQLELISSGNFSKKDKSCNLDESSNRENSNNQIEDYNNNNFYNDDEQDYNFTYMDKKLRKMLEK